MTLVLDAIDAEAAASAVAPPTSLIGLTREALAEALAGIGVPERQRRMRASQLWRWIYNRGATLLRCHDRYRP